MVWVGFRGLRWGEWNGPSRRMGLASGEIKNGWERTHSWIVWKVKGTLNSFQQVYKRRQRGRGGEPLQRWMPNDFGFFSLFLAFEFVRWEISEWAIFAFHPHRSPLRSPLPSFKDFWIFQHNRAVLSAAQHNLMIFNRILRVTCQGTVVWKTSPFHLWQDLCECLISMLLSCHSILI